MPSQREIELLPATAITATGNTGVLAESFPYLKDARFYLTVSAVSGTTPSATVIIEDTVDGVNFHQIHAFTAATAVGSQVVNYSGRMARRLRIRWTVTGTTPSLTIALHAVA